MATGSSPTVDQTQAGYLVSPKPHQYRYPRVHAVQIPPATYASHIHRQPESPNMAPARLKSSVSSEESSASSSNTSMMKPCPQQQTYWHASSLEQGLADAHYEKSGSWSAPTLHKPSHPSSRQEMVENNSAVFRYIQEQQRVEEDDDKEEDHAYWILFWISCLDPIHSTISAVYTLLVVLTLALVSPIRLCQSQSSFGDQVIRSLAPIFKNHLELMYAPSVEDAFNFDFKPASLVVVHLTAPFLSLGIMLAGWVSAVFWLFTLAMGNPDGTEKHDDGRDTVIQVRDWWERYLLNAIRQ